MSGKRAYKELTTLACKTAADGEVTNLSGFVGGASGTGSCTLTDTSLYTFTFPRAFTTAPAAAVSMETASLREEVTTTTTTCVVRLYSYNGTTKTAGIFSLIVTGKRKD